MPSLPLRVCSLAVNASQLLHLGGLLILFLMETVQSQKLATNDGQGTLAASAGYLILFV